MASISAAICPLRKLLISHTTSARYPLNKYSLTPPFTPRLELTWTSWNKIRFDLSQLQHLTALLPSQDLYRDAQGRFVAVTQLNDTYVAVQQFIKDSGFNDSYVSSYSLSPPYYVLIEQANAVHSSTIAYRGS